MFKGVQFFEKLGETVINMKTRLIIAILGLLLIAPVIANPNGPPWQNGSDMVIDTGCTCHGDGRHRQKSLYQSLEFQDRTQ